jgi:preprotein translocase subunit YajC
MTTLICIIVLVTMFLIALERERQRRAKHRAKTSALLAHVAFLPMSIRLERNLQATWQG